MKQQTELEKGSAGFQPVSAGILPAFKRRFGKMPKQTSWKLALPFFTQLRSHK